MRKVLPFLFVFVFTFINAQETSSILKVGDEVQVNVSSNALYSSNNSGVVYTKEFRSVNSGYIKVYFENFDLNQNDFVKIYGANTNEVYFFTGQGKTISSSDEAIDAFWSTTVWDDHIIVELHSQSGNNNHYGFDITKVAYGYEIDKITGAFKSNEQVFETVCGIDDREQAACYDGTEIGRKSNAICRLLIGGASLCTGWLLGTEGHVMTNNHCIGSVAAAANTEFWFNYRSTDCSGLNNDATNIVATSATFIQTSDLLDFTLVQLPVNPVEDYGYLSFSSVPPAVGERIYQPQHPGGARNQIAVFTDTNPDANGFSQVASAGGNGSRVTYFHDTQGGSSGSPVLRFSDHLVIALHNTGGCPNGAAGRSDEIINAIGSNMPDGGIDDPNPDEPRLSFGTIPKEINEGTDCGYQEFNFNVRLAREATADAELTFLVNGTATENVDFELLTNSMVFTAGESGNKQITIRVYNDAFVETNEGFSVRMELDANGGDAILDEENKSFRINIIDDDNTPDVGKEVTLMSEDFESDLSDWTVTGAGILNFAIGDATSASSDNWSAAGNSSNFAFINDDACNCDMSAERLQYTQPLDLTTVGSAFLDFDIIYLDSNDQYASDAFVQTSINNGATWQNLGNELVTFNSWGSTTLDLSSLVGESNVLISFLYNDLGNWSYALAVDNVTVRAYTDSEVMTATNDATNSTQSTFSGQGTMYSYDLSRGSIISKLVNNNAEDFGCTNVHVSRSGSGGTPFNGSTGANLAMEKQYNATTSNSVTNGDVDITFYFTENEIAGWESAVSAAGGSFTRSDLFINRTTANDTESIAATLGTYQDGVTLTGNFSKVEGLFSFVPEAALSINENDLLNFSIYPNPTQDFINIESRVNFDKVEVYSLTGKKLNVVNFDNQRVGQVDISNLSSGIYFIKIHTNENQVTTRKIMKQ